MDTQSGAVSINFMDTENGTNIICNNTDTVRSYRPAIIVSLTSCILSILGSFIIFGTFVCIPEIRTSTRKLLICLTSADVLTALGILSSAVAYLVGTQDEVCLVQSAVTTFSSLVSFFLTIAIALHIFVTVCYRKNSTSSIWFLLSANAVSWLVPGVIIIVALTDNVLGRDGCAGPWWCWLKDNHKRYEFWMFMSGKGWEFLCYLLTTSFYVWVKMYLYIKHKYKTLHDIHESLREEDQNYLYVWFVLYVLRLWGSIRSMMGLTGVDTNNPGYDISGYFLYIQAFGDPAQAFCNCLLFCFLDRTVRSKLFSCCVKSTKAEHKYSNAEKWPLLSSGKQSKHMHVNGSSEKTDGIRRPFHSVL